MAKKRSKKSSDSKEGQDSMKMSKLKKRFRIALKNLAIFTTVLILSFILAQATIGNSSNDIFVFASIILAFIVLAFLISLLVLGILKQSRKKKEAKKSSGSKGKSKKSSSKKKSKKK